MTTSPSPSAAATDRPSIFWLTPDRFDLKQDRSSWSEMAAELSELGWNVNVVTSRSGGSGWTDPCRHTVCVPSIDLPFIFRITAMISSFRLLMKQSRDGDIFIINEDMLWWVPLFRLLGRRHVHLDIRTVPVSALNLKERIGQFVFWTLPLRLLSGSVDSYSFITRALQKAFERDSARQVPHACVWASGVNTRLFHPMHADRHRSPETFEVFYHGSIRFVRGLGELVRAMASPVVPPNARLTIVGEGPDRPALEALATQLGLEDRVRFSGRVPYDQIPSRIAAADVCVCPLPDRPEWNVSSPLKVLESLACGKPVILTPIPAHLEIADQAPFVVWAKDHQPESLAHAIRQAFDQRDTLARAAGCAHSTVSRRFEWRHHASTLDQYLNGTRRQTGGSRTLP